MEEEKANDPLHQKVLLLRSLGPNWYTTSLFNFLLTLRDTESMTDLCLSVLRRDRLDDTSPTANASLFFRGAPQPRINETYHPSPTSPSSYYRFVAVGHRPGGSISSIFIKHVISVLP